MGTNLSRHLMSRSSQKQHGTRALAVSSSNNYNDRKSSSTIMEMIKPECLKTKKMKKKKKKKKTRVHDEMNSDEKKITKVRKLTLEEWLLASPAPASMKSADHQQCFGTSSGGGGGGGELSVFKQFSKKVHPSSSSSSTTTKEVVATTLSISKKPQRDEVDQSFSMDDGASANFSSSMCRSTQSGRLKKRVSFKLPDEADIFVFYSPGDKLESN
ncbi:hypothetical protein Ddye_012786 [Dipteronia dyeriana]|uniref:Uncharacterized protein n=1 Tax=Dipteronia dyeriana TaxID=168575 RepID=A0AAE0CJ03_9ROSI|nr:hypothetical protein Ddye_012786 [Dipteronia dyeriana]